MKLDHSRIKRCAWVPEGDSLYQSYHDTEWGVPVYDDQKIFEFLVLESAQAGLSWITVLRKRENYRKAFADFDPVKVARFSVDKISRLLLDPDNISMRACPNQQKNQPVIVFDIRKKPIRCDMTLACISQGTT